MKHRIIITLLMAVVIAAGCSKSDTPDPSTSEGYEPSTTPISFQTNYNWGDEEDTKAQTKGIITTETNFDNFGVLGYYLPSSGATAAVWNESATPNFMYNQLVSRTKNIDGTNWNSWTYSPIKYWPNNTNDRIQFFAYAPHDSKTSGINLSANTQGGYPSIDFTINALPSEQVDLVTAQTALLGNTSESVQFDFTHQLTKLNFAIQHMANEGEDIELYIDYIALLDVKKSGTLAFQGSDYSWNIDDKTETTTVTLSEARGEIIYGAVDKNDFTTCNTEIGSPMLMPQDIATYPISLIIYYHTGQSNGTISTTLQLKASLPIDTQFAPGSHITYKIKISTQGLHSIGFEKSIITEWKDVDLSSGSDIEIE